MKLCFLTAVKSQICQITSSVLFKQSRRRQRCSPCGWVCRIPCGRCGSSTSGILGTRRAPGCTAGPWSQGGRSRSRLRSPHGSSSPWRDKDRLQMLPCRGAQSHVETISRFNWSELFHPPSQHDHPRCSDSVMELRWWSAEGNRKHLHQELQFILTMMMRMSASCSPLMKSDWMFDKVRKKVLKMVSVWTDFSLSLCC